MPMLAGPPGMMPPSPMGMQGHAGQLQLARRGTIPSLGYHAGGHEHMMLSPGLSAGHPSPVSPMQMQQLQAAAGMRGRPNHPSMMGVGVSPYGQSDFGDMQQYPQVPPTPTSPHVAGGGFLGSNPMQAQVSHQMHGMQVHPGSVAAMGAMQGAQIQGLPMPADSADAGEFSSAPPVFMPRMDDETGMRT